MENRRASILHAFGLMRCVALLANGKGCIVFEFLYQDNICKAFFFAGFVIYLVLEDLDDFGRLWSSASHVVRRNVKVLSTLMELLELLVHRLEILFVLLRTNSHWC